MLRKRMCGDTNYDQWSKLRGKTYPQLRVENSRTLASAELSLLRFRLFLFFLLLFILFGLILEENSDVLDLLLGRREDRSRLVLENTETHDHTTG